MNDICLNPRRLNGSSLLQLSEVPSATVKPLNVSSLRSSQYSSGLCIVNRIVREWNIYRLRFAVRDRDVLPGSILSAFVNMVSAVRIYSIQRLSGSLSSLSSFSNGGYDHDDFVSEPYRKFRFWDDGRSALCRICQARRISFSRSCPKSLRQRSGPVVKGSQAYPRSR
jgi:hypothetical protein